MAIQSVHGLICPCVGLVNDVLALGVWAFIQSLNPAIATVTGIVVLCGLLAVPAVKLFKRAKRFGSKVESGMDSLLGYGPVLDPATGRVLQEATPSMAIRVDKIETAILSLAETQRQIVDINNRLTTMEEWREQHQAWSDSIHPAQPQIVQNFGENHPI